VGFLGYLLWTRAQDPQGFASVPELRFPDRAKIETPALFYFGAGSRLTGFPEAERIREHFVNNVIAVMQKSRGFPYLSEYDEFYRVLQGFLAYHGLVLRRSRRPPPETVMQPDRNEDLAILADVETSRDLLWVTGFTVGDPLPWFQVRGRRYLVASDSRSAAPADRPVDAVLSLSKYLKRLKRRKVKGVTMADVLAERSPSGA